MPFSVSRVVEDPNLGQPFTIIRTKGTFAAGGWQASETAKIPSFGVIVPADEEALAQVPEGDRVTGAVQLFCVQRIYQTQVQFGNVSDKIDWNDQQYRVVSVQPWVSFGFWAAVLVRMSGE